MMIMIKCDGCHGTRNTLTPIGWSEIELTFHFCAGCQANAKKELEVVVEDAVKEYFERITDAEAESEESK